MIIVVHTLAFGGRGIFFAGVGGAGGRKRNVSSIFPSILDTAVLVGSFFTGDDNVQSSTWTCNVHPCTLEAQVQKKKKRPSNNRRSWKTLLIFCIFLVVVVWWVHLLPVMATDFSTRIVVTQVKDLEDLTTR